MARKKNAKAAAKADLTQPDDSPAGYGRPPVQHRFKPGVSGNPKGRPKGRKSPHATLRGLLMETVPVRTAEGKKRMTVLEALGRQSLNGAMKRDPKSLQIYLMLLKFFAEPAGGDNSESELPPAGAEIIAKYIARLRDQPIVQDIEDQL